MLRFRILFKALVVFSHLQAATAITAGPGTETIYSGSGGINYRVCTDTDFQGGSTSVTQNVASVTACAQLCDQNAACFKAVYDTQALACHFKANTGLTWATNTRYDVIYAEQINIARCPFTESTYTNNGVR
jgi:galactose oxidase